MKYIATLSGGKDSTVMCDLLLKNNYPVDYIIFNDTTKEFPQMYDYISNLKKFFKDRYNKDIITTFPIRTFKESILRKVTRSKTKSRNGQFVGIPVPDGDRTKCHLRKTLKQNPTDIFIRKYLKGVDYKVYVGFTTNEKVRATKNNINIYPLIDYFNMSELDCKKYLIEQDMENILYKYFTRTGCSLCPFKSERDWFNIYHNFKDIFFFLLHGRRKSEVLNITWDMIDLDQRLYYIPAKINKAKRNMCYKMTDELYQRLYKHFLLSCIQQNTKYPKGYVFINLNTDKPYRDLRKPFQRLTKTYNLPKIRLHDLRHLIGSYSINYLNLPIEHISYTLGHTSIDITQKYITVKPQISKDVIDKIFDSLD